ncbi:MAG TPA: hypothetical protein VHX39_16280, partial [Acetobacteraceae bacterium]|nr:hypothetical protein [Acetobacteraceae bacterium]
AAWPDTTAPQRLIQIKAPASIGWQPRLRQTFEMETPPMTTMTMPTTVAEVQPKTARGGSQLLPFLLAMVFLMAAGVGSILISGPMH